MVQMELKTGKSEVTKFSQNLRKLTGKGTYKRDFLQGCADFMLVDKYGMKSRAFGSEQDPTTGEAWADHSAQRQKERAESGRAPNSNKLVFSNTLKDSIQKKILDDSFIIGTNVPYAKKHQTEGVGSKKIKRKFLGINERDYRGFNLVFKRILQKIEQLAKAVTE